MTIAHPPSASPSGPWNISTSTKRRLVDAITLLRVPIAAVMLVTRHRRCPAAAFFMLGVVTDLIDGPLARKFGTASARGARLDSAADAVFVAASAVAVSATVDEAARPLVGKASGVVSATRLAALLLTRFRFGRWSVIHTRLNKATGLSLAPVASLSLLSGRMPVAALGTVGVLAELAAVEELAIVATASDYDADRKSILVL